MASFYEPGNIKLGKLVDDASDSTGAKILIPNLQRSFVWKPGDVTLLVDSLIRGWPFGSLLFWAVDPATMAAGGSHPMPKRSFWSKVSNVDALQSRGFPLAKDPSPYTMVLDGQQRVQSLLLAFKGADYGFVLKDHKWTEALDLPVRKQTDHWCQGCLCVDLALLDEQLTQLQVIEWVDYRTVLKWVVIDPATDKSPGRTAAQLPPIPELSYGAPLVPLAKFWEKAVITPVRMPGKYDASADALLNEYGIKDKERFIPCCVRLLDKLEELKGIEVHFLQVLPCPFAFDLDKYNDAVINIFTRLNAAGRLLTKQEITFAWIKMNWAKGASNGNREAEQCFKDLDEELQAKGNLFFDIDELVRGMSAVWASICSNGTLLSDRDLLKEVKLKPLAHDLGKSWNSLAGAVLDMSARISNLGLRYRETYYSLNALFILWGLEAIVQSWLVNARLNVTDRDNFDKDYENLLNGAIDRWFFLSQWAGTWSQAGDTVFEGYLKQLSALRIRLCSLSSGSESAQEIASVINGWLDSFKPQARLYVDALSATSRGSVRQYFGPLWVWNRLDAVRWDIAKVQLREFHRRASKLLETDVDHIVPVKLWATKTIGGPLVDEAGIINSIGNCSLLERTFNIAKSAEPAYDFFAKVHDFRNGKITFVQFVRGMRLKGSLLRPTGRSKQQLASFIHRREDLIKKDLKGYVNGTLQRVDL
jgi:hypothetical protein